MAIAQERPVSTGHWNWNPWLTLQAFWGQSRPRHRHLDVAALSEHLQRDMGFLDGTGPSHKQR
jgi:hypothetical protein